MRGGETKEGANGDRRDLFFFFYEKNERMIEADGWSNNYVAPFPRVKEGCIPRCGEIESPRRYAE